MSTDMFQAPRSLTPEEFFRLQGQQDFLNFINQTNRDLGMLQGVQEKAGDGNLLDENTNDVPTQELDPSLTEDAIFQILMETIIGEQGIPEGVSAEVIEALRGDFGPTTIPAELQEVAIDIAEAGGFDEWYAQQDLEGPPEELPTELEEEVSDINEDTTLEDEIGVDPDMPINIPPPTLPPQEGNGNGEGDSDGEGEGDSDEGE